MGKIYKISFILIIIMASLSSCIKTDDFYTNIGTDYWRIPLVKPYQLINSSGTSDWGINFPFKSGSISEVREINVISNIIFGHSDFYRIHEYSFKESWFIYNINTTNFYRYLNKEDFRKKLFQLGIKDIKMYSCEELRVRFEKTLYLPWFPEKR